MRKLAIIVLVVTTLGCGDTDAALKQAKHTPSSTGLPEDVLRGRFAFVDEKPGKAPTTGGLQLAELGEHEQGLITKYAATLKKIAELQKDLLTISERWLRAAREGDRREAVAQSEKKDLVWLEQRRQTDLSILYGAKLNNLVSGNPKRSREIGRLVQKIAGIHPNDTATMEKQAKRTIENLKEAVLLLK